MNLSHLYYFRKLAEVQHYTHAAEQLFITQPTLSNAVSQLEKELGIALFERGKERAPYEAGQGVQRVRDPGSESYRQGRRYRP